MAYEIHYSKEALAELDNILEYIAVELCDIKAAKDLFDDIMAALKQIKEFPHSSPLSRYGRIEGIHQLAVKNFAIFYYIDEIKITIVVLRVKYAKSDLG